MRIDLKGKPVKFFPYESVWLQNVILTIEDRGIYDEMQRDIEFHLGRDLRDAGYEHVGFDKGYCRLSWDNKVTFEMERRDGDSPYYIQFYDGTVYIGLSVVKRNYEPTTHYLKITKSR